MIRQAEQRFNVGDMDLFDTELLSHARPPAPLVSSNPLALPAWAKEVIPHKWPRPDPNAVVMRPARIENTVPVLVKRGEALPIVPARAAVRPPKTARTVRISDEVIEVRESASAVDPAGEAPNSDGAEAERDGAQDGASPDGTAAAESGAKPSAARTLLWHHLMMLVYLNTVGGPFGIEPAVGAGGPLLTIVGVFVVGFGWGMPQSLMSAELSLLCEAEGNGGDFNWVNRAFGLFGAFLNACNNLTQFFVSNALLLTLFAGYIPGTISYTVKALLMFSVAFVGTVLNLSGTKFINRVNMFIVPAVLVPFYLVFAYAKAQGKTVPVSELSFVPPLKDSHVALFLSTNIWCFGGFDRVGNAAAEIVGGRRTYVRGLSGAILMGFLTYAPPVALFYLIDPRWREWKEGTFVSVGFVVGKFAGWLLVLTAMLSCFGQYQAAVFPLARLVWAVSVVKDKRRQMLPRFISRSWINEAGVLTPYMAIIVSSIICATLSIFPFAILVESFLVFRLINLAFEYGSLIAIRIREPDAHRPFRIPGGMAVVWLMICPVLTASTILVLTASRLSLMIGLGFQPFFLAAYFLRMASLRAAGVDFAAPIGGLDH